MSFFKIKFVGIGIVVALAVLMIFGLALMGSTLGAKPKNIPVALVVLDQPAKLPDGNELDVGAIVKEKLTGIGELPVKWVEVGSEAELEEGLANQDYYGALVLPADLSAGIASLQSPAPKPATVRIVLNEGTNAQAVLAVKMILQQMTSTIKSQLSSQLLGQIGQQTDQIPVAAAQAFLAPFQVTEQAVHSPGDNNANGNAPNLIVQIMWLGCLVTAIFMFLSSQKHRADGAKGIATVASQLSAGLVIVTGLSAFLLWMAHTWYGMETTHFGQAWLYLWLLSAAFFLVQTALFNWIGLPSIALLVLIFFFSMPVIGMPPEFMSQATSDWLYSWTPFRYAANGLRDILYFGGEGALGLSLSVLVWLAVAGFVLAALSAFKPKTAERTATSSHL
ncbi:ABC transporter permease [Paenibacillus montanisoli]|uniref:DUF3533 domain-containing protein n=1 Tax=Paenibacillus montanisoli TaxID=2081970 RepID=A0A328U4H7_9BACL|nr:ABC transporter permease [Paenibacillus montanisoli]RAP77718.1 DUF3533 domain-containing protein [Paenibacillus montanisoli]